jgi:hypothetical protein
MDTIKIVLYNDFGFYLLTMCFFPPLTFVATEVLNERKDGSGVRVAHLE